MASEAEYENRLAQRVAEWTAMYPDKAAAIRLQVRRKFGKLQEPPAGSLRAMVLDEHYREAIRELRGWPTAKEWLTSH